MNPADGVLTVKLPSRAAFLRALASSWEWDTHGPSMVLTGSQGVGKTVLLDQLCARLEGTAHIIRWWTLAPPGGRSPADPAAGLPQEIVGLLASSSGPSEIAEPGRSDTRAAPDGHGAEHTVVRAFQRARTWLHHNAQDAPVLVVVDDVHLLQESHRHVLAQLTRNQEISLLLAATSIRLTGRAMSQLWRDGVISDHRIPDLSLPDVTELLRAALGREPEITEAVPILRRSQGVVGHAVTALGHMLAQSNVGNNLPDPGVHNGEQLLCQALSTTRLDPDQVSIVQVLSRLRQFPASVLIDLFGAQNLDALMDTGVLRLQGRGPSRGVVLTNTWIAGLVPGLISEQRDRELYDVVAGYSTDARVVAGARADLELWRHALGLPLDPVRITHLAESAAVSADYNTVQALIRTLDPGHAAPLRGLHTLALAGVGQIDAATELARPLLDATPDPQHPLQIREVEALYVLAAMSTQQRRATGEFETLLAMAQGHHRALMSSTAAAEHSPHELAQNAALEEAALSARWILENFRGDYKTLLDSLARASAARSVERTTRALMVGLTAKANAVCGRPTDGQAILTHAVRVDLAARNARLAQQHTEDAAMIAAIFGGQWSELLEQVQGQDGGLPDTPAWVQHNVLKGALLLLTGRPHKSVGYLEAALKATADAVAFPVPHLVVSLTAAAFAWVGRHTDAKELLRMDHTDHAQESYLYRATGEYFRGLTEFLLGDVAAGVQRWRSWADDTMVRGCHGLALVFLQALARAGSEFAVRELTVTAQRCQGAWAESLRLLAVALDGQKITDLRAALRSAAAMGDLSLAGYLERLIAVRGHTSGTGPVVPFPDDEVVEVGTGEMDARAVSMAAVLTSREREIADLAAAGLTNQSIAEQVGLSRRTVEGHMLQVLRKLNMSRRNELVDLWRGAQGD
ncbi:helix-turn-helix transcriptional regulator [Kocuria sp. ZOR0020]|uniref:helix-turn-helix transcriptional regulator n=1 Tax=Kocuria sp. ZOR0020 TaxID=1339234 RepID=UPI000648BEBC|nr:helix-turn-helix transcriptional regulator [Kocuria sp. ZOR0020]